MPTLVGFGGRWFVAGGLVVGAVAGGLVADAAAFETGSVPTVLSLRTAIDTKAGSATLRGELYRAGNASARIRTGVVYLQRTLTTGTTPVWTNVGVQRTSSTGSYVFTVRTPQPYTYQVKFTGSPTYAPTTSRPATIPARFRMSVVSLTQTDFDHVLFPDSLGQWLTATGTVPRGAAVASARITRYEPRTGRWIGAPDSKFSIRGDRFTIKSLAIQGIGRYRVEFYPVAAGWYGTTSATYSRSVLRIKLLPDALVRQGDWTGDPTGPPSWQLSGDPGWQGPYVAKLPPGRSAWMALDVRGCVSLGGMIREEESARTRFSIRSGSATLQSVDLTSANRRTAIFSHRLAGATSVLLSLTNLSPTATGLTALTGDLYCGT